MGIVPNFYTDLYSASVDGINFIAGGYIQNGMRLWRFVCNEYFAMYFNVSTNRKRYP